MPVRDLSHPLDPDTPVYPGDPPVTLETSATLDADGVRVTALSLGSHAGTHVDAPSHTEPDGRTVDELPVESLAFEARRVALDPGPREAIARGDLPDVPDDIELLVLDTGWAARWGTDAYRDHPYLAPGAAAWCADRGLAVGLDTFGPDPTPPSERSSDEVREPSVRSPSPNAHTDEPAGLPAHRALLGAGCLVLENLTGLDGLPERFALRAFPLRIAGCDASPVRAVAEW